MANQRSTVEKFLSLFSDVHSGEAARALLMTLNIFLILTAYLMAKVVREPLILSGGGAELKSYASAAQVLVLLGVVKLYAWMVTSWPRRKLINLVTLFFTACLILFYLVLVTVGPWNGAVYFLWVGIFSLVVIAQFWSYANDTYTPEQGKRLFVILAFGASAGGVFGPMLASLLLEFVGVYNLLLVSAGTLLLSLLIFNYIDSRKTPAAAQPEKSVASPTEPPMSREGALKIVFANKYLLMIAVLIMLSNLVNTTGEYILGRIVEDAATKASAGTSGEVAKQTQEAFIGKFYADFYTIVGFVGLVMQLVLVSRIIKYLGVGAGLMMLPIIAVGSYALIAIFPVLTIVRWSKTLENSVDYSLNNTVRQMLFLPTTREEKYKAKVAIDSVFVRAGDVSSALLVFVGVTWLAFGISHFGTFCLITAAVTALLALSIGRRYRKLIKQTATGQDITDVGQASQKGTI